MVNPFPLGYWGSEGIVSSPYEIIESLRNSHLPEDLNALTFTYKREEFPPLEGVNLERMFGADVQITEILYSEGWEPDGLGASLLLFGPDESGQTKLQGMIISHQHFDK